MMPLSLFKPKWGRLNAAVCKGHQSIEGQNQFISLIHLTLFRSSLRLLALSDIDASSNGS